MCTVSQNIALYILSISVQLCSYNCMPEQQRFTVIKVAYYTGPSLFMENWKFWAGGIHCIHAYTVPLYRFFFFLIFGVSKCAFWLILRSANWFLLLDCSVIRPDLQHACPWSLTFQFQPPCWLAQSKALASYIHSNIWRGLWTLSSWWWIWPICDKFDHCQRGNTESQYDSNAHSFSSKFNSHEFGACMGGLGLGGGPPPHPKLMSLLKISRDRHCLDPLYTALSISTLRVLMSIINLTLTRKLCYCKANRAMRSCAL